MNKFVCIHGHFYQPPRENPWLEDVELQESAHPYHDWNQRITAECYAPNIAARILDPQKRIRHIVNNYSRMSFNFGPTLLSWMQRADPESYAGIIDADRLSQENFGGHGSALAQCYNHIIMPLANARDKQTQVAWGIWDFLARFGRKPEGMWLPETAVDIPTLEALAWANIQFTILASHQAQAVRRSGEQDWQDVSGGRVDGRRPYRCVLPSGKEIALFFYDGPIARDVAFGSLLERAEDFESRMLSVFSEEGVPQLSHIATDGETYGHHHHRGDMALASCLELITRDPDIELTNYGQFLEQYPPGHEVQIIENSSWSCCHGIERWRNHCGCSSGGNPGWQQEWRAPLREAYDLLRDRAGEAYESQAGEFFKDVWAARDDYIVVIQDRSLKTIDRFLSQHVSRNLSETEKTLVLKMLESQRNALLMYTSCGWFFDEISGIETVQTLAYASRVMQLTAEFSAGELEEDFLGILARAPSNLPSRQNAKEIFLQQVKPMAVDLVRVGTHYAVSSLFEQYSQEARIFCYTARSLQLARLEKDRYVLVTGRAEIRSEITLEHTEISYAVMFFGGHRLIAGVRLSRDEREFQSFQKQIQDLFRRESYDELAQSLEVVFPEGRYTLRQLFRDEQTKVLYQILDSNLNEIRSSLRQVHELHRPIIQVVRELRIPLPKVLANTVLVMINSDLLEELAREDLDLERLQELVGEVREWKLEVDRTTLAFCAVRRIEDMMARFIRSPRDLRGLAELEAFVGLMNDLNLPLDLWRVQNMYYDEGHKFFQPFQERAQKGHRRFQEWISHFERLGHHLQVNPSLSPDGQ